jgi:hypothetical protein
MRPNNNNKKATRARFRGESRKRGFTIKFQNISILPLDVEFYNS